MKQSSPYLRAALLASATVGIVVLIVKWSNPSGSTDATAGFATPEACLDAFRDANADGNAAQYLRCLGEPLRSETRRKYPTEQELGQSLRKEMKDVKSWAVKDRPDGQASKGTAVIEQVCAFGIRELRLQLERSRDGWMIVAIEDGRTRAASVPYGTAVGQEPEGGK